MVPLLVLPANCTKFKNTGARYWFYAGYPVMIGGYIALFRTISPVLICSNADFILQAVSEYFRLNRPLFARKRLVARQVFRQYE